MAYVSFLLLFFLPSPFAPFAGLTAFLAPLLGVFGGILVFILT
jgi:hypothetical protein